MRRCMSWRLAVTLLSPVAALVVTILLVLPLTSAQAVQPEPDQEGTEPEPAPPANQSYIGVTKCAACHFEQFLDWRQDQEKHVKAFDIVSARYRSDAECLKCHTTGYGKATGFKSASDKQLAGVTCEACHGPGSTHAEVSKPFANKKNLQPAEEKIARDSIYRMQPQNVCVTCHATRAHKKHPDYQK